MDTTVREMSRLAAAGKTPAEIARWLRATLGPEATYFAFVAAFFQAFQNPLRTLRDTEYWYVGSMTDDQLNDLLSPLVIRTRPIAGPDANGG
jgi:hypothetical protein